MTNKKILGIKDTERVLGILNEVHRSCTMECASFSDELKEKTRLYRQTWMLQPLERIINKLESNLKGEDCICLKCASYPPCKIHKK